MTRDEIKERDILFCELLFDLGSVKEASEQLGITLRQGRKIAERNKDLILDMTNSEMAAMAYKSVSTIRKAMEDDGSIPKGELRLKAATETLDRIGVARKNQQEVEVKASTPVILMPSKDQLVEPTIRITTSDEG